MIQFYSEPPPIPASREGPTPLCLPAFFPILSIISKFPCLSLRELQVPSANPSPFRPPVMPSLPASPLHLYFSNLENLGIWSCLPQKNSVNSVPQIPLLPSAGVPSKTSSPYLSIPHHSGTSPIPPTLCKVKQRAKSSRQ